MIVQSYCRDADCTAPVDTVTCSFCDNTYIGPNCGHVAQPAFVSACAGCGRSVCEDHADVQGRCPACQIV